MSNGQQQSRQALVLHRRVIICYHSLYSKSLPFCFRILKRDLLVSYFREKKYHYFTTEYSVGSNDLLKVELNQISMEICRRTYKVTNQIAINCNNLYKNRFKSIKFIPFFQGEPFHSTWPHRIPILCWRFERK